VLRAGVPSKWVSRETRHEDDETDDDDDETAAAAR
jgi:hypothetical protein